MSNSHKNEKKSKLTKAYSLIHHLILHENLIKFNTWTCQSGSKAPTNNGKLKTMFKCSQTPFIKCNNGSQVKLKLPLKNRSLY